MNGVRDYHTEIVAVLDFGSQYTQLIARKVRELNVYCEIFPYNVRAERLRSLNPLGIILSGGPASVNDADAPVCDPGVFEMRAPILGICYGVQSSDRRSANTAGHTSSSMWRTTSSKAWKTAIPSG